MAFSQDALRRLEEALEAGNLEEAKRQARTVTQAHDELASAFERLRHTTRLAELGQLTAEIIHEMRQPLLGVKAYAQIIETVPQNADMVKAKATSIVQQADRMEALLERVRRYAKGGYGQAAKASVNAAVAGAIELLEYQLKKTHLKIEKELAEPLPEVRVHPGDLQQIFVNLLVNAREAIGASTGTIRVRTLAAAGFVEAYVEDDGPGVPNHLKSKLFHPFATGKANGTGLGLFISRNTAERGGGTLELLESERGCRFCVRLPALS